MIIRSPINGLSTLSNINTYSACFEGLFNLQIRAPNSDEALYNMQHTTRDAGSIEERRGARHSLKGTLPRTTYSKIVENQTKLVSY